MCVLELEMVSFQPEKIHKAEVSVRIVERVRESACDDGERKQNHLNRCLPVLPGQEYTVCTAFYRSTTGRAPRLLNK